MNGAYKMSLDKNGEHPLLHCKINHRLWYRWHIGLLAGFKRTWAKLLLQQSVDQYLSVIWKAAKLLSLADIWESSQPRRPEGALPLLIHVWEENQITHCALLCCLEALEKQWWKNRERKCVGNEIWERQIIERGEARTNSSSSDESTRELQQEERQIFPATRKYETLLNDTDTTDSICTCPTPRWTRSQEHFTLCSPSKTLCLTFLLPAFYK